MSAHDTGSRYVRFDARDLVPGSLADGRACHLMVRDRSTGRLTGALCGGAAWTQAELDAQLAIPPRIIARPPCLRPECAFWWPLYWAHQRRRRSL